MKIVILFCLISFTSYCQPGDPSGDPDSINLVVKTPTDPTGDPDRIQHNIVCDSINIENKKGIQYIVLFYRGKRVLVCRKDKKMKFGQYEFY